MSITWQRAQAFAIEPGYFERLWLSVGPGYKDKLLVENDDGTTRLATEAEIENAAGIMPWVREWLDARQSS